jgi:ABC-type dipeptide/oligopeptide/nickel transport system permease subunit
VILAFWLAAAILAGVVTPHDPNALDIGRRLEAPSLEYPLGTDNMGRCLASRLMAGATATLSAALAASLLSFLPGLAVGLAAGMAGRRGDALLMGLVDVALAFPGLLLAVVLAGVLRPSLIGTVWGLALVGWPWWSRLVRSLTLEAKNKEFVVAGIALGLGRARLTARYYLPLMLPPLLVALALRTGSMLVAVSGLSYLGLGAQPPLAEWGRMLEESRVHLAGAPWLMIAPGTAITSAVAGFYFLAEGLRDRMALKDAPRW